MSKLDRLTLDLRMDERLEKWEAISKSTIENKHVFDDLNASSTILTTGLPVNDPEFGRIVERKVFGAAVDWDDSTSVGRVPVSHVTNLLDAIRQNTTLPSPPPGATLYERLNPVTFYGSAGADISQGGMSQ
ncbi:hypothetical protein HA402_001722 [Bradysia odoriphaga]|nr:hypothetical protein HA402_001722 [Bradysia odoriphaga]